MFFALPLSYGAVNPCTAVAIHMHNYTGNILVRWWGGFVVRSCHLYDGGFYCETIYHGSIATSAIERENQEAVMMGRDIWQRYRDGVMTTS